MLDTSIFICSPFTAIADNVESNRFPGCINLSLYNYLTFLDYSEDYTGQEEGQPGDTPQAAESAGRTEHDTSAVQQADGAKDAAGEIPENQEEEVG